MEALVRLWLSAYCSVGEATAFGGFGVVPRIRVGPPQMEGPQAWVEDFEAVEEPQNLVVGAWVDRDVLCTVDVDRSPDLGRAEVGCEVGECE